MNSDQLFLVQALLMVMLFILTHQMMMFLQQSKQRQTTSLEILLYLQLYKPVCMILLTAVYLDVDNDNLIKGADWALITLRANNAINIESFPNLVFKDSFE